MFASNPYHDQISLLETAFSQSQEGMLLTDSNSNIITANPAFCQMTGYKKPALIGKNPNIMQSGVHDKNFYQKMWQAVKEKGSWHGDIWDRKRNGEVTPRSLKIKSINDENDNVIFYLGLMTDQSELHAMTRLANHDPLTNLPNRRFFEQRLEHAIAHAKRNNTLMSLLYIDLDHFKHINDSCGHRVGDLLLIEVARRLKAAIREEDTAARIGGDEFVIILSKVSSAADARQVSQKIIKNINMPFQINEHTINVGCSIGYSIYPEHCNSLYSLLHVADSAMYQAKKAGRNTFCCK